MTNEEFDKKFDTILERFNKHVVSANIFGQYTKTLEENLNNAKTNEEKFASIISFCETYSADYSSELLRTMLKEFLISKD